MEKDERRVVSIDGNPERRTTGVESAELGSSTQVRPESRPEDVLRLIRAFFLISDPSSRAWLVEEAEKIARA